MTDPKRLIEERPDAPVSTLLRHARGDAPPANSRAELVAALGLPPAPPTAPPHAVPSFGNGALIKWGGLAVLALVVIGGGVTVGRNQGAVESLRHSNLSVRVPMPARAIETVPASSAEETTAAAIAPPPKASAPAAKAPKSTLADEVAALEQARRSLANDDASGALGEIDSYEKRFRHKNLSPEAEVLRIEALAARGDTTQAASLAQKFLAAHPSSPLGKRVRSVLAKIQSAKDAK